MDKEKPVEEEARGKIHFHGDAASADKVIVKYTFWCRCGALELETKKIMAINPGVKCLVCGSAPVRMTKPVGVLRMWLIVKRMKWSTTLVLLGIGIVLGAAVGKNPKMMFVGLGIEAIGAFLAVVARR